MNCLSANFLRAAFMRGSTLRVRRVCMISHYRDSFIVSINYLDMVILSILLVLNNINSVKLPQPTGK
jgi:hypothetical protein